jgi:hypothetical protein
MNLLAGGRSEIPTDAINNLDNVGIAITNLSCRLTRGWLFIRGADPAAGAAAPA